MRTWWSGTHLGHRPAHELSRKGTVPHVEVPDRAERVLAAVTAAGLGPVAEVVVDEAAVRAAVEGVHTPAYVAFLADVWREWVAAGRDGDALPIVWPVPALCATGDPGPGAGSGGGPESVDRSLARWSFDAGTPICAGTWDAAVGAAACALAAADAVAAAAGADGGVAEPAFALCRPPGHHAAAAAYGGYCYLNNAAVAAQRLRDRGAARVAVLDVDYHHGNGTQAIFWGRDDVFTASLHADPRQDYPYFTGHASERGAGAGDGANLNLPLPWGTGWEPWSAALDVACEAVAASGAEALVVPLGVDTYAGDPISRFRLETADYPRIGARLRRLGLPTIVVLEGGYATEAIGANVAGVLTGLSAVS